jgi:hypothetical protein
MSSEDLTPITSRNEFHDAVRAALAQAADAAAGEIFLVDPSFVDWPLNERGVVESLGRWASSRRRFVMIAQSFDELARRAPRFVEWRRQWSHIIVCRANEEAEASDVPTLLCVPGSMCLRLDDRVHYRGRVSLLAVDQVASREAIDALLQRSVDAFPATTIGL